MTAKSCDELSTKRYQSQMSEWGNPAQLNTALFLSEHIGQVKGTAGIETSQYRIGKESNCDSLSSGERNGISLNLVGVKLNGVASRGLWE